MTHRRQIVVKVLLCVVCVAALAVILFFLWLKSRVYPEGAYWSIVATILGVMSTLTAVSCALFVGMKDEYKKWESPVAIDLDWFEQEPYLSTLSSERSPPDEYTTSAMVRLKATNVGRRNVSDVTVLLQMAERRRSGMENFALGEAWVSVPQFVPINLKWTHIDSPLLNWLPNGTARFIDVGLWEGPQQGSTTCGIRLSTEVQPDPAFNFFGPGEYKIELSVITKEGISQRCLWRLWVSDGTRECGRRNDPVIRLEKIKATY